MQVDSGTAQCCYNTKVEFYLYAGVLYFLRVALDSVAQSKLKLIFRIKCNDGLLLAVQVDSGTAQRCYNTKVEFYLYAGLLCFFRVALDSVAQGKLKLIFRIKCNDGLLLAVQVDSGTAQCCYTTRVEFDLYAGLLYFV